MRTILTLTCVILILSGCSVAGSLRKTTSTAASRPSTPASMILRSGNRPQPSP